jgi:hypothetical protein
VPGARSPFTLGREVDMIASTSPTVEGVATGAARLGDPACFVTHLAAALAGLWAYWTEPVYQDPDVGADLPTYARDTAMETVLRYQGWDC